jgi:hypothetical protein
VAGQVLSHFDRAGANGPGAAEQDDVLHHEKSRMKNEKCQTIPLSRAAFAFAFFILNSAVNFSA